MPSSYRRSVGRTPLHTRYRVIPAQAGIEEGCRGVSDEYAFATTGRVGDPARQPDDEVRRFFSATTMISYSSRLIWPLSPVAGRAAPDMDHVQARCAKEQP